MAAFTKRGARAELRCSRALLWFTLAAVAAACSASGVDSDDMSEPEGASTTGTTGGFGDGQGSPDTGDLSVGTTGSISGAGGSAASGSGGSAMATTGELEGEDQLPEEIENPEDYRIPVATGRYLWSANPQSGRVALVDAVGLSVEVLSAGLYPTYLTSLPDREDEPTALVINVGSSDVTRFVVRDDQVEQDSVAIHTGANRWASSKNWAVAWTASEAGSVLDPTSGLQEITVLSFADGEMKAKRLAVDFRPRAVQISEDESLLTVVARDGINIIHLDDDPTSDDYVDLGLDAEQLDVALSGDGSYALVRKSDENTVDIINLRDPQDVAQLTFSGPVTDVDLAPNGRAVAVIRKTREIATFVLSEVLEDASKVQTAYLEDQVFGSAVVTDDGEAAVLFTNAVENDVVNIVNLKAGDDFLTSRQLSTQSPVYSVVAAPKGEHAVVLAGNGDGAATNAFSVISLKEQRFPRVVGTRARVRQVAMADDFAIVTAASPLSSTYEAYTVVLPELTVEQVKLASEPLSVGALPAFGLGYVAQTHDEGRVTFFDFENNDVSTLTGFELSAEVVDE